VARPGGGGGVAAPASEPAATPAPASPAAPQATPRPRTAAVARRPPPTPVLPPESTAPAGGGASDGVAAASGGGGGDGSGGDGSGGARVAYGTNPLPPYPLVARRLGVEGDVLLAVWVAPGGRSAAAGAGRAPPTARPRSRRTRWWRAGSGRRASSSSRSWSRPTGVRRMCGFSAPPALRRSTTRR